MCLIIGRTILMRDFNIKITEDYCFEDGTRNISLNKLRSHPDYYTNFMNYNATIINSIRPYLSDKFTDTEIYYFMKDKYTSEEINDYKNKSKF